MKIKIETSYFAKYKLANGISISRFTPSWFTGEEYKRVAPTEKILKAYKNGDITEKEYEQEYRAKVLDKLDAKVVAKKLNNKVALCYETSDKFCHRHILAKWLNEQLEIDVKEYTPRKYRKIVIGIDESYQETGIGIIADKKLLKYYGIKFKGMTTKTEKRQHIAKIVKSLSTTCLKLADETIILVERIRTFSKGGSSFTLSTGYIKATAALIATIVDTASLFGINVYSVDTRSWKAQVLGSSKSKGKANNNSKNSNKNSAIQYVKATYGVDVSSVNTRGRIVYDDNIADGICIAEYGFLPPSKQTLKLEQ